MQAQQQGDERPAAARALPGALQGVHAATLRRRLLAIQRSSANSTHDGQQQPRRRLAQRWCCSRQCGPVRRLVTCIAEARRRGRLQGQQQGTRHLWIAQGSVARGIPVAGQRQQDPVADALLPQQGGALGIAQDDAGVGSRLAGSHHPATGAQPCLPIRRQCVAAAPDADLAALGQGMRRQRCGQRPRAPRALQCIQPVLGGGGRSVVRAQPRNGHGRPGRSVPASAAGAIARRVTVAGGWHPGRARGREHARSTGCPQAAARPAHAAGLGSERTGCTGRLIDGGEAGGQPMPVALVGGAAQRRSIQPRGHDRPRGGGWRRPGQRRSCQQYCQRGQQTAGAPAATASHRSGCAGAAGSARAASAARRKSSGRVRMAAGQVDQTAAATLQRARPGPTGTAGSCAAPAAEQCLQWLDPAAGRASRWHGRCRWPAGAPARRCAPQRSAAGSRRGSPRRHPAVPRRFPGRGSDGRHRTGSRARRR